MDGGAATGAARWGTFEMRFTMLAGRRLGAAFLSACALLAMPAAGAWPAPAAAQEGSYFVQIAARPTLREGEEEARRYAARVAGVNGFQAAGGWYVVALGPFSRGEADERLGRLRAEGRIPSDSFLVDGARLRGQFYPTGAARTAPAPVPTDPPVAAAEAPLIDFEAASAFLDGTAGSGRPDGTAAESPAESRAAEALLTEVERDALQVALASGGFYQGPIDGDFGPGTRAAMSAWQGARGLEATGVLTGSQRTALLGEFNAVLDGLGLALVRDAEAGIDIEMPSDIVAFAGYETPFARYEPSGALPEARVVLISQEGGRDELAGLYEAIQTLAVVPPAGPRQRTGDSFDVEGRDARIVSRAHAVHAGGRVKGFMLVWPAADTRFERLWQRMLASFDPSPAAVLGAPRETPAAAQDVDLLAGLEIRQPDLTRSGFFVDGTGRVLTTAEVAEGCRSILLDDTYEAALVWADGAVALLDPAEPLAPPGIAAFADAPLRIGAGIAVGGYPFGGALGRPSVTFGRLSDVRGLAGEPDLDRYEIETTEAEAGGPVVGPAGEVAGMLAPPDGRRVMPPDVALGLDADGLRTALRARGIDAPLAEAGEALAPEEIARRAADMTVQVSCYR